MGGDEFVILLPNTDTAGAVQTACRINALLEQPIDVREQRIHVGSSIGIATYPDHAEDPDVLMRHADVAMYSAKQANIGYAVYAVENDSHSSTRLALGSQLRDAIHNGELILHYQPKMHLASGEIDGVEALVRWNHPQYGLIPPDQFIPLAEHSGMIRPLTTWVLDKALKQCRQWEDLNLDVGVAVNLSTRSLHDPDLPAVIVQLLAASGASASRLTVEITESVIMANPEHAMDVLGQLTDVGIKLSIDDFGTGYSSLSYLRHLRAHELKIDRSFVMDLDSNDESGFIVRSVVELGHNLGLEVVAEGVESQKALDILSVLKCDRIQGYYLSRPQTAEDLTRWIQERTDIRRSACEDQPKHVPTLADVPDFLDVLDTILNLKGGKVAIDALA
jgi:predicted signal transduction protein with EAL and GGDEF domain